MAVITLVDHISVALNKSIHMIRVFPDFQKRLIPFNHWILCDKLKSYGKRGLALKLFSYLARRSQFVIYVNILYIRKLIVVFLKASFLVRYYFYYMLPLYNCFILPYFTYCIEVLVSSSNCNVKSLFSGAKESKKACNASTAASSYRPSI